jgi:hypothetical protein
MVTYKNIMLVDKSNFDASVLETTWACKAIINKMGIQCVDRSTVDIKMERRHFSVAFMCMQRDVCPTWAIKWICA